ncbi:MAG: dTDP-4-dehydrorhamnose reductase [Phycisphaerae bacterium]|nr:dTDP-4-dehydrorhamnose reductase [Phycisphaerae bacterium]
MLGQELMRAASRGSDQRSVVSGRHEEGIRSAECRVVGLDIEEIDITEPASVDAVMDELRPRLVINAAAYTDVDGCESNRAMAMAVNAEGPANLARACQRLGARLVHVSTDYVFDGCKDSPYLPEDPVDPQSVYGRSKAEGERGIREILTDYAIVRTSWLFAAGGKNFVKTILKLAGERDELRVVTDQVGRPTYAADLAQALVQIGERPAIGSQRGVGARTGHFCNAGACSWFEFAAEIVRLSGKRCRVLPTTTADFPRPARRPAYSVLSTDSLEQEFGIRPRDWREALAECLAKLQRRG